MDSIDKYLEESAQVAHEQKQLKSVFMIIANEVLKAVQEGGQCFFVATAVLQLIHNI